MVDELFFERPIRCSSTSSRPIAGGEVEHVIVRIRDPADLVERERAVAHDGRAAAPGQCARASSSLSANGGL